MVSFMPLVAPLRIRDSDSVTLTAARKSTPTGRIHLAWVVAAVSFIAILGAAGFRSVPGVMMTASWQLVLLWGVLVGVGTGSISMGFVAIVAARWFEARRGLVTGVLTA